MVFLAKLRMKATNTFIKRESVSMPKRQRSLPVLSNPAGLSSRISLFRSVSNKTGTEIQPSGPIFERYGETGHQMYFLSTKRPDRTAKHTKSQGFSQLESGSSIRFESILFFRRENQKHTVNTDSLAVRASD